MYSFTEERGSTSQSLKDKLFLTKDYINYVEFSICQFCLVIRKFACKHEETNDITRLRLGVFKIYIGAPITQTFWKFPGNGEAQWHIGMPSVF